MVSNKPEHPAHSRAEATGQVRKLKASTDLQAQARTSGSGVASLGRVAHSHQTLHGWTPLCTEQEWGGRGGGLRGCPGTPHGTGAGRRSEPGKEPAGRADGRQPGSLYHLHGDRPQGPQGRQGPEERSKPHSGSACGRSDPQVQTEPPTPRGPRSRGRRMLTGPGPSVGESSPVWPCSFCTISFVCRFQM